jgi:leucine-zipper-like transcriptional regulator 1
MWVYHIEKCTWECIQESSDSSADGGASGMETDSQVKGSAPSRRFGYVSVVHNGKLVIFGGFNGTSWLSDTHEFSFATKTWREIPARGTVPTARSCPAWAKDDTHVFIHVRFGFSGRFRSLW